MKDEGEDMRQDLGASQATGLAGAEAPEPDARLGPTGGIPSAVYVIVRSTGEYSDRDEQPIRYVLTEDEAKAAVDLAEAQGRTLEPPPYRYVAEYGYRMPDGTWLPDGVPWHSRASEAKFTLKPNATEITAQNEQWRREYEAACLAMGCVDPGGPSKYASYYYGRVTLIASAGEAGTAETTQIGSAEGEHATAKPGRPKP